MLITGIPGLTLGIPVTTRDMDVPNLVDHSTPETPDPAQGMTVPSHAPAPLTQVISPTCKATPPGNNHSSPSPLPLSTTLLPKISLHKAILPQLQLPRPLPHNQLH